MKNGPYILSSIGQQLDLVELSSTEAQALAFLLPLSEDYPEIDKWYRSKVIPGLKSGTRKLLPIERDGHLVGLGIAKREQSERKICTVRVDPRYANKGIGVRIFDGLLHWLDVDHPHLTVSAGKLPIFKRIFDYYGFNLTSVNNGLYVPHGCELGYNEAGTALSSIKLPKQTFPALQADRSQDLTHTRL